MKFYLGTSWPEWLSRLDVPFFVSYRSLRKRRQLRPMGPWALDSGAFTELEKFGKWSVSADEYADDVRRINSFGKLDWASVQDWLCVPPCLAATGLTIRDHQERTITSLHRLRELAPEIPWAPILQGWTFKDFMAHIDLYEASGVDLAKEKIVGLGSIAKRQGGDMTEFLTRELLARGIRIHAFGMKKTGLIRCSKFIASADSMSWSFEARYQQIRMPECVIENKHQVCKSCWRYALKWRGELMAVIERSLKSPVQETLF